MRSTTIRAEQLSLDVQQQIDACCDKYEQALKTGQSPSMADYLTDIAPAGHAELLRELTAIELAYRRTQSRGESEGLHLRCPHCQNQVELLADARLEEITCKSCGDTFSLVDENSATGGLQALQRIAHFELIARLGTGGFGSVWEARDMELDRLVAIKIPRKRQLTAREAEQFFREARTAAQLKHPHIVPVHEVGKEGAIVFIVTDLIHGVPLSESLKGSTLTTQETAQLCATLADALAYAHQQGVIHRDLKPANVMLDRNQQPHIMDFGLAKREMGEITMTIDGTVLGTPAYMSPEQAMGKSHWIDRRSDIYSLGVMLFQMLTQELPYRGTAQQQIQQRVVDDAPDPRKLNAHIPADLATICLKCLERDPNRRFASAAEFAAELTRYLAGEPIKSRPISNFHRAARWAMRKPALATAAVLTGVLAIVGPLTALTILNGNRIIAKQLVERDEIILRKEQQKDELARQLGEVRDELERFQELKPNRIELADWRKRLIESFVDQHQATRKSLLQTEPESSEATDLELSILAHLGWGYLLRAAGQHAPALEHSVAAHRLLSRLQRLHPEALSYRVMLAECLQEMSELQRHSGEVQAAARSAEAALLIRAALADENPELLSRQIDEFDSRHWQLTQLDSSAATASQKEEAFTAWQKMKVDLQQKLAGEPHDFYALACYLTLRRTPLLGDLPSATTGQVLEQNKVD